MAKSGWKDRRNFFRWKRNKEAKHFATILGTAAPRHRSSIPASSSSVDNAIDKEDSFEIDNVSKRLDISE
jgi:hypothetical protein